MVTWSSILPPTSCRDLCDSQAVPNQECLPAVRWRNKLRLSLLDLSEEDTVSMKVSPPMGRRAFLTACAGAGLTLGVRPPFEAMGSQALLTKAIPSTGERLPVVGVGTALGHYVRDLPASDTAMRRRVFDEFTSMGGRVLDIFMGEETEAVCGQLIADLGRRDDFFIATKVGFFPQERPANPGAASIERMNASFSNLRTEVVDLMQVANLFSWDVVLPILREWKAEGRFRYIGVTVFQSSRHEALERVMRGEELDFVQLNYSLEGREAENRLLPLAAERGIAVIANVPFARGGVFRRVGESPLPGMGCRTGLRDHSSGCTEVRDLAPERHMCDSGHVQDRVPVGQHGGGCWPSPGRWNAKSHGGVV